MLFQILIGTATAMTVASIISSTDHQLWASIKKSQDNRTAWPSSSRPTSSATQPANGSTSHPSSEPRIMRASHLGKFRKVKGPKFQMSSLLGIACRIKPPIKPAMAATGVDSHS